MMIKYQTLDLYGKMLFERALLKPPFRTSNSMHGEACFVYILEGKQKVVSETESVVAEAGHANLMKCGQFTARMLPTKDGAHFQAVAIHFHADILRKIYDEELPGFLKTENPTPERNIITIKANELVSKFFDSILFYFENPELVNEELLVLKTKEFMLLLDKTSQSQEIRDLISNMFSPRTYSFKEVVGAHLYDNLSLQEMAILTNMSLSSFKREFRRVFESAPARYLREKKVEKAKEMLTYTDLTVGEIAFECGFPSLVNMSTVFAKEVGVSPTTFRKSQVQPAG